jgi:hypothetical protein
MTEYFTAKSDLVAKNCGLVSENLTIRPEADISKQL